MKNKKYKLVFLGNWGYGNAGLNALIRIPNIEICKVFSIYDLDTYDQYLNQVYHTCVKNNISVVNCNRSLLSKVDFENHILNIEEVDFLVTCCFDRIISKSLINHPLILPINVHPSILPKYRGIKPLENAIINADKETGVTLHVLTCEIDAGDILLQKKGVFLSHDKTYKELYNEQCKVIEILLEEYFENTNKYILRRDKQNASKASYAPRLNFQIIDDDKVQDIIRKSEINE